MAKRRSSTTPGIDQIAAEILEEAVGKPAPITPTGKVNPAAANARRKGGIKRGAVKLKGAPPRKRMTTAAKSPAARAKAK